jgi:peptidyl-prolyl cis-trans isomerase C
MKKYGFLMISLTGTLALCACQPKGSAGAGSSASTSSPIAVVNGEPISRELFDFYIKQVTGGRTPTDLTADQRNRALDSLIRAQVVAEQAKKDGELNDPDTQNLLALSRLNVLEQAVSAQYLKSRVPTQEQLHAEYDRQVANMPHTEYRARHILVSSEPFAQLIIKQLEKGANFAQLAAQDSIDSSKTNGGEIGWFTPDHMVKPFADAVESLKPGEFTHTPVHTQYGWHIIQLEDERPFTPPSFDSVQQRLVQIVESKEFTDYVDGLMKQAKIQKKL